MKRLPFFSNSDRRALLLLEWIMLLVVLALAIYSWRGSVGGDSSFSATADSALLRPTSSGRKYIYAKEEERVESFPFDPNTADSVTLLRLGLASWQVRAVYNYRAKHGRYHTPEDFQRLPGMTNELWERLHPYIRIDRRFQLVTPKPRSYERPSASVASTSKGSSSKVNSQPLEKGNLKTDSLTSNGTLARSEEPVNNTDTIPHLEKYAPGTVIDLNAADTSMLMKIPGIASYRASKIVEYRQRLGGFRTKEQVMEACRMPDEVLDWFTVQPVPLERLEINHLSLKRLMHHPYISFYQAQAIVEYRKKYGPLHSPQELQKLQDFTPEAIERVQDYLDFRE